MDKKLTEMNAIQLRKNWGSLVGHCRCLRRYGPRGSIFYLGEIARWKERICGKVEERRKGTHHEHFVGVHLASFNPPSQRQEEGCYNLAAKRATRVGEVQND